jgi:putative ABC transport system permease protein
VVLLIGAALMIKSFVRLTNVDVGFNPENVLSMELRMLSRANAPDQVAFVQQVLQRLESLPGVTNAGFVESLPARGGNSQSNKRSKMLEGPMAGDPSAQMTIEPRFATPGYFQTMGIRLLSGRLFSDADNAESQPVVVVSERMAVECWPGEDPIGKRLLWNWKKDQRPMVIGVVADVRRYHQEPSLMLYFPFSQNPDSFLSLAIRGASDASSLMSAVRNQIFDIDRRVVIDNVMTMEQRLGDSVAQPRFYALLLSWFAGMGMLLAVIGLYGVLSYTVSQQTREVAIRVALGAQHRDILTLVVGQGLVLTIIGLAVGLAGAVVLSRLMRSLLFGVAGTDPATYVTVSLMLLLTAVLACYLPARRATKIDPMLALRYE